MKGLIIGSGKIENYSILKNLLNESDFVVCADGGVNHILRVDELPDVVLGDLDSIGAEELSILKESKIIIKKFPVKKDKTDMELCIDYLLGKRCKNLRIIGGTGTRLDHTISNVFLLKKIYKKGVKAKIIDDNNKISYTEGVTYLSRTGKKYVSIIPISESGAIISLEGFLYELSAKHIQFTSTFGISNELIKKNGKVTVHRGSVLIIESMD